MDRLTSNKPVSEMTELPCPHRKDIDGVCCCMQEEGSCEYQMLSGK